MPVLVRPKCFRLVGNGERAVPARNIATNGDGNTTTGHLG